MFDEELSMPDVDAEAERQRVLLEEEDQAYAAQGQANADWFYSDLQSRIDGADLGQWANESEYQDAREALWHDWSRGLQGEGRGTDGWTDGFTDTTEQFHGQSPDDSTQRGLWNIEQARNSDG